MASLLQGASFTKKNLHTRIITNLAFLPLQLPELVTGWKDEWLASCA